MPFTLPRSERLRSMKAIRRMFGEGSGGFVYPFRYVFLVDRNCARLCVPECGAAADTQSAADVVPDCAGRAGDGTVEVMFSVPKKFHKRANRRNLLKRRMREAYRLNCAALRATLAAKGAGVDMAMIYSTKECHSYKTIENAVQRILDQIGTRV